MANMTKSIRKQLGDLKVAAANGLPRHLRDFVWVSAGMLEHFSESPDHFPRRKDLQTYVNTLHNAVDALVNNPRRAAPPVKPKAEPIKKATPKAKTEPIVRTVKKVRVGATRISRSKA